LPPRARFARRPVGQRKLARYLVFGKAHGMRKKMKIRTARAIFKISNLDPAIDKAFANLYRALVDQRPCDLSGFKQAALEFFGRARGNTTLQDRFFSNLSPLAKLHFNNEHWHKAENVWRMALEPALEWESQHPGEFIHKGTPFYFWGMAAISRGELDLGYTLMHQALKEDIRTQNTENPQIPAFAFAILDYDNVRPSGTGRYLWPDFLMVF
jgi:hypothetical protein